MQVLNTGFCPRAERNSVEIFCKCLTFSPHSAEDCKISGYSYKGSKSGKTQVYRPPMNEFNILATTLENGEKETLAAIDGPSILLATKGSATIKARGKGWPMDEGTVFFIAQGTVIELDSKDGLLMHTAYADATT